MSGSQRLLSVERHEKRVLSLLKSLSRRSTAFSIEHTEGPMHTHGIYVHKHESQVTVLDGDDEVVRDVRLDNANLEAIAQEYER